jgi:hypothetical protein
VQDGAVQDLLSRLSAADPGPDGGTTGIAGAEFLRPGRRGDIARPVLDRPPTANGPFDTVPAVVHNEILFALTSVVRVVSAASMGTLRATELWTYRDGRHRRDLRTKRAVTNLHTVVKPRYMGCSSKPAVHTSHLT